MVNFAGPSYGSDPFYAERFASDKAIDARLKKPIIPANEIGITIAEHDQIGGARNMVEGIKAAIRMGTGAVQLVFMTHQGQGMFGRPKAYGEEIRRAIRETVQVNKVNFAGAELPTSLNNLAGYNPESGNYSEDQRRRDLDEVKDAIKFVADVGGGGVDILSWEYNRNVSDASWNQKKLFETPGHTDVISVVDTRTGRVSHARRDEHVFLTRDPQSKKFEEKEELDENGLPKLYEWKWEDFVRYAEFKKTEAKTDEERQRIDPETLYVQEQIDQKIKVSRGHADHYMKRVRDHEKQISILEQVRQQVGETVVVDRQLARILDAPEGTEVNLKEEIADHRTQLSRERELVIGQQQEAKVYEEMKDAQESVRVHALKNSVKSYAEAGIAAMEAENVGKQLKKTFKPVYVGPEIGWPHAYGSHPEEFVELIRNARSEMATMLEKQGFKPDVAAEEAKKHIKGTFDTAHMGMWLQHFKPDMPWDTRVKEFNKWYLEQVDKLAAINKKEQILGGIQAVDSASAAHGHIPAGQGIFPVVEATKKLKEADFGGFIVSEGHEEEKFGAGRIMLKTWEAFGSPITGGYNMPDARPPTWGGISNYSFGRTYSPSVVLGGYAPSADFRIWSETVLE